MPERRFNWRNSDLFRRVWPGPEFTAAQTNEAEAS